MTPEAALSELLGRIGAQQGASVYITTEGELSRLPAWRKPRMKAKAGGNFGGNSQNRPAKSAGKAACCIDSLILPLPVFGPGKSVS
jgi:hypothetical protein